MKFSAKILIITLFTSLLLNSCSNENCENKPHDCICAIDNGFPGVFEIIDSLHYPKEEMNFCRYSIQQDSLIILKGQTKTQSNGYFYNESAQFQSLIIHKFRFYNEYEKRFLFELKLYEFKDANEALVFEKFKESISRELTRSKEKHSFIKKNGKCIMYNEGSP